MIVARGPPRRAAPTHADERGRRPARAGWCCPASSTPTCTSRRSAPSAGSACRCSTGWRSCALPEEARLADAAYAAVGRRRLRLRPGARRHHDRAGLRLALRRRRRRAVRRGHPGRAAGHQRPGASATGSCARTCSPRPSARTPRGWRWPSAGTASGPHPLRRHPALLAVLHRRRCWSRPARCWPTCRDALVHLPPQRERRGDRGRARAVRLRLHDDATTGTGCSDRAACSPTTCTRPMPSCGCSASAAPRSRTARPATPRWAAGCSRSARTSRSASGSRSAPTSAPAPGSRCSRRGCRPTSPSSCSGREGHRLTAAPPAPPGHRRRRRGARAGRRRSATSRSARSSTPSGCAPPPARPSTSALRHADSADDALAKAFALAGPADVARPGSPAHRFVCGPERRKWQQTADESGERRPRGCGGPRGATPRLAAHGLATTTAARRDASGHEGGHWKRVAAVSVLAWLVHLRAGPGLGLAADPPARVVHRPDGRRHRPLVRRPAHPGPDRRRERRDVPRRDDRRRSVFVVDRAAGQPAEADAGGRSCFVAIVEAGIGGFYFFGTELIPRDRPPVKLLDAGLVPDASYPRATSPRRSSAGPAR